MQVYRSNQGGIMFKKILLAGFCIALMASCSKGLSREQYIDAMSTLGCKNVSEGTPEAQAIYKDKKITQDDIQKFRKSGDAKEMLKVSMEIASRVMACHGVTTVK